MENVVEKGYMIRILPRPSQNFYEERKMNALE
jgi:hypothetical protein